MKLYKGFDKNMKCRDFQYEEGKTYTYLGTPKLCDEGFHACEIPLDCLKYYAAAEGSIYREVEMEGVTDEHGDDSKRVGKVINIGVKLRIRDLVRFSIDIFKKNTEGSPAATSGDYSTAATSGDKSTAATSGYKSTAATSGCYSTAATSGCYSTAATSGDYSTAATSGDYSTAATSGYKSTAATSGDYSIAVVEGKESIALAGGYKSKAKGALGCWLVLAERDNKDNILGMKAVKVDGVQIKPDTFYILKDGEVVAYE